MSSNGTQNTDSGRRRRAADDRQHPPAQDRRSRQGRGRTGRRQGRPDHDHRQRDPALRRPHGRRRRPPRDPARRHHRADRPQRRGQDHAVQPAVRLRQAQLRHVVVRRHDALRHPVLQGGADGSGAHVPAHQGAVAAHRAREHEARCHEAAGREASGRASSRRSGARRTTAIEEQGAGAARALQARREGRRTTPPHCRAVSASCSRWPAP